LPVRLGSVERSISKDSQYLDTIAALPGDSRQFRLIEAVTLLGNLFDDAMARANKVRACAGWSVPIRFRHQVGGRCYYTAGQRGLERTLALYISVPLRDGDLFGGAYIKPGGVLSAIYVVPSIDTKPAHWNMQVTNSALTCAIIDDLFRATFSEDVDAAHRLAPMYGFDLFATPWS
jgi:hypothetical protein